MFSRILADICSRPVPARLAMRQDLMRVKYRITIEDIHLDPDKEPIKISIHEAANDAT